MNKTINLWVVAIVFVCVLIVFFWCTKQQNETIAELKAVSESNAARIADLENKQTELKSTLASAGSEAFIENQARTQYGYMMPDEIRFVISGLETEEAEESAQIDE